MRQTQRKEHPRTARTPTFECSPWTARERIVDEPRHAAEPPLQLEQDEHVVDAALDVDAQSIRRDR